MSIPDGHKDHRCYRDGKLNPGWAWSAHYQLLSHRHDARRQTRDFTAWQTNRTPGHKDHFSGKEEAIGTTAWIQTARTKPAIAHLFRHDDELGAVNLIKRVWHKAYLEKEHGFEPSEFKFASVLGIAAAPWKESVLGAMREGSDAYRAFLDFRSAVEAACGVLDVDLVADGQESQWLKRVDASVFHESFWNNLSLNNEEEAQLRKKASAALSRLIRATGAGQPGKYFAVLALDGDQIGKWLSGEKTPTVGTVITEAAAKYFGENVKDAAAATWLKSNRPLSPSYHLQFSEALANFGLYCAARIVEAHHGQLIYSGGDDVLAMLPAEESVACALGLRLAFQGKSNELVTHADGRYAHLFDAKVPAGFVRLKDGDLNRGCRRPAEPSWPLLVPGAEATVSVGISIGHIKEPLQDMIKEAQVAEKRAKADPEKEVFQEKTHTKAWQLNEGWGRDALAVVLFKRSGETIRWGSRFGSPMFGLLDLMRRFYRVPVNAPSQSMPISGKFPYRVAELLERYDTDKPLSDEPQLHDIAAREIAWIIQQQTWKDKQAEESGSAFRRAGFEQACLACLDHLRDFEWDRPTATGTKERARAARPLRDFIHLFALEAFIARQGD